MDAEPLIVMTTCADAERARTLATALVDARLAACVNMIAGVASTYRWNGAIEQAEECLLLIKSTRARFAALEHAIRAHSSYQIPEIVAVPIAAGSSAYLDWVAAEVAA